MKTRLKKKGMMKSSTALTSSPSTLAAPKKSVSTERVRRFRLKQMNTVGYDHEETKKETRERVATIRAKKPKCPLGQKRKGDSCSLHSNRGPIRNRQLKKTRQLRALAERRLNRRNAAKEHSKLQAKISELTNKTRRLTRHLKIAEERIGEISGDDTLGLSTLQCMTPNSKNKTLKRVANTPGLRPIRKRLRETCNVQVRNGGLFTNEEIPVSNLGEKVIAFMLDNDNNFECPD